MYTPKRMHAQRGQAFLIVVLVMVVALTVALSIASRTLTNVRLTTEEVTSQRAFSAAEAGVEQMLQKYGLQANQNQSISNITLDTNTNTKISDATISPVAPIFDTTSNSYQLVLNNDAPITQDDGYDIWLTPFNTDPSLLYQNPWPTSGGTGNLSIYWGDSTANTCSPTPSQNSMAAMELVVIYNTRSSPIVTKYAFDPCALRDNSNKFTPVSSAGGPYTFGGRSFLYKITVGITSGLIARVIPVYASAVIGISSDSQLPAQGQMIVANGVSGSTSQIKRQISYFQAWNALPSEYYHALFVR